MSRSLSSQAELRLDISVCTFRRPELADALRSLACLNVRPGWRVRVVVADNDVRPSARELVTAIQSELPFPILYVHCPSANISIARNACLDAADGDFLAFLDDDETAKPDWLAELVTAAQSTGADAVLGPVQARYDDSAPGWMRRGDFHSTFPVWVNGEIRTGYTCNVLLRRSSHLVAACRFSLARGRTGGEDTEFFTRLHESGGRIVFAPEAWVEERVPAARARFSWLARRRFRFGQTHGHLLDPKASPAGVTGHMSLAGAKAGYCFLVAAAASLVPHLRNRYALRGIMHVGVISGLLGVRELQQYGDVAEKQGAGLGT